MSANVLLPSARRPLFSIIIPSLDNVAKLDVTLHSVVQGDAEVIVIDGGSRDRTLDLLGGFGCGIKWISASDEGVYDAMNKGIRLASGKYLLFLGTGDRLRAGILDKVAAIAPENLSTFIYGNVFMQEKGVVWDGVWTEEKFRTRNICQQAIFYGREIFERIGGFDLRYKVLADYAMNIRCFGDPHIEKIFIDEVIADYEGSGLSSKNKDELFYHDRPELLQKHLGISSNLAKAVD